MHLGIILFYLPDKRYGYLLLLQTQEQFHFTAKNLRTQGLAKGDLVRFSLREDQRGYYADEIVRADLT